MVLSDYDIIKFQDLCKEIIGMEISREDAYEKGIKLLQLVSTIYKPMTREEYELVQRHRKDTLSLLTKRITNI